MPGQIKINTDDGKKKLAQKQLKRERVVQAATRCEQIMQQMDNSPTVAQRTAATKDLARMMKHILNHLSR
jgi:hypothetical protein